MVNIIKKEIQEHLDLISELGDSELQATQEIVECCLKSLRSGGKLLLCGNGGSAADAQHLAAEFVVRFRKNRSALAAIALTTDASALTAAGNDFSFKDVFSRQVEALGRKGDVLVAISTSGNSPNVVAAARAAQDCGMNVVGITGCNESELEGICDILLQIPSDDTARIQEAYLLLGHIICGLVESEICKEV